MKIMKRNLIQLAILCLLGASVALTLILPELPGMARPLRTLEISVLVREADTALWSNARLGMEQAAGDLGAELRFLTPALDNDHGAQTVLLLREAKVGTDALVVIPADPSGLATFLDAQSIIVPVVTMESPIPGGAACITPENESLGRALAEACLEDRPRGGVLLLDTAGRSTGVASRLDACAEVLKNAGEPFFIRHTSAESLLDDLAAMLSETGAGAVITFEYAATEALAAGSDELSGFLWLYGVGTAGTVAVCLERNTITATAAWSDYAAGYLAVQAAIQAARKESHPEPPQLRFTIVRGEDIYEPDNQKLLFPVMY